MKHLQISGGMTLCEFLSLKTTAISLSREGRAERVLWLDVDGLYWVAEGEKWESPYRDIEAAIKVLSGRMP